MASSDLRDPGVRPVSPSDAIEFLLAEHLNHRRMCRALEDLADARDFDGLAITALVDFIRFDLTLHVIDEEEDVFPLLRRRCLPEDEVDEIIERLGREHAEDKTLSERARDVLNACLMLRRPPQAIEGGAEVLRAFAHHERRHLALENAVIIPLARRRLDTADIELLGRRFMARRRRVATTGK
ncbi:MAG: hemerythrin domain-containing protein [Hyphomonadaceae bacterium]|nr:hemerythrin domain-containing protein [Hyphomonadaceae bacterium]